VGDDAYGATVAKRRLARELAELRVSMGLTANQVCDRLGWGRGKVGRFEANQWKRPEMSDVRDLLRLYEVPEAEQQRLTDLALRSRARAWWREYPDVFANEFPGYESDANRISVYMPLVLPALLQAPAYIETQLRIGNQPSSWRERALEARLRRQEILNRTDPAAPHLRAVITEAALSYRWGTEADWQGQLRHLLQMSQRDDVDLRLLRFADGPHPGMCSLINLFQFPDDDEPATVYVETDIVIQEVTMPAEVQTYAAKFDAICAAAASRVETSRYLKDLLSSKAEE
jgi:transcriptional regulator with XRE-family HTH domain